MITNSPRMIKLHYKHGSLYLHTLVYKLYHSMTLKNRSFKTMFNELQYIHSTILTPSYTCKNSCFLTKMHLYTSTIAHRLVQYTDIFASNNVISNTSM